MKVWHEVAPPPFDDCFHDCLDIYEEMGRIIDPPDTMPDDYGAPIVVECEDDPVMRELLENKCKEWNAHSVRCVDCEYYHALSDSATGCKGVCGNELEARKFVYKYSYKLCENYRRRTL